jgi:sulfotransferase
MNKTYDFMAGLPRSGSTVLSALLNQHPKIYSSPQTDLLGLLYSMETEIPKFESYRAGLLHKGYASVMYGVADSFYSHIDKPKIIDKNRGWGTPYNFENLSGYVNPDGKVILTMRPILEVLASFVKVSQVSKVKNQHLAYFDHNLWVSHYRDEVDAQVENLMLPNGEIDRAIYSIANLLKNYKDRVHVVWYQNLLLKPQATMDSVYQFLGVDPVVNNFEKIITADKHNDLSGYGIEGLHDVRKKLVGSGIKPSDYLSQYSMQKYKNALDFLNLDPA